MPIFTKRILCIEDHDDTCEMLCILLRQSGYSMNSANGYNEAMKLVIKQPYDLYILDNELPDGTGIDLCQRIRQLYPNPPIIFYAAAASKIKGQEALSAGAQAYIQKPDLDELLLVITKLVNTSRWLKLADKT